MEWHVIPLDQNTLTFKMPILPKLVYRCNPNEKFQ